MKYSGIVLQEKEPNKDSLWIKDGAIMYFNNGEWKKLLDGASTGNPVNASIPIIEWDAEKILVNEESNEVDFKIQPGVMNKIIGPVGIVTLRLEPGQDDVLNEYMLEFSTDDSADSITIDYNGNPVIFTGELDEFVTLKPNYRYQVSVVNGVGVIAGIPEL